MPKHQPNLPDLLQEAVYSLRNQQGIAKQCLDDMTEICQVVAHLHGGLIDRSISHVVIRREAIAACEYLEWILAGREDGEERRKGTKQ